MKRKQPKTETLDPGTRRLFSYLDGELDPAARTAFEAEAGRDPVLTAELRFFRFLLGAMKSMEPVVPPTDLEVSVIASLRIRPSLPRRLWMWLAGSSHEPASGAFGDLLDGRLTTRQAAALSALAAGDADAARILAGWRRLGRELSRLPEFAPADGFADRVMARVQIPEATRSLSFAPWRLRSLWPGRQERLAAASGIAVGPVATMAGIAYMLFANNPLVTLSNLGSFLWGKSQEAFLGVSQGLIDAGWSVPAALEGSLAGVVSAPVILASLLMLGLITLASGWILYRNIFNNAAVNTTITERRHASV